MNKESIVLLTNATAYTGPGVLSACKNAPPGHLVCHDQNFADEKYRKEFEQEWTDVHTSTAATPEALVDDVISRFGRIDALISNDIGSAAWNPIEDGSASDLRETIEELVVWPYRLLSCVALAMKEAREGRIVFVTSAAPVRPTPGFIQYVTARAASSAMARAAAKELAPFGIQINAVAPNFLESELYYPAELWSSSEADAQLQESVPIGRLGRPEEVGELIMFLLSGRAEFLTGEVVHFTGGWS